jgi:L-methionine (R)-S-oxide reductase
MKPEHVLVLQEIESVVRAIQAPAEQLTEVCRLLQRLPHYTGVYIYALEGDTLVLRAYHGRATEHVRIPSGKGICGASVQARATVIVADVASDPRYLACNLATRSEIVVPIMRGEIYLAQIDVDSDDPAAFGAEDEALLREVARRLEPTF